jgi:hypothetical protein
LHHDTTLSRTSFFTREVLTKINMIVDPLPPPTHLTRLTWPPVTFLFPWLKTKLKGHHFDTTVVNKTELQAVPNTFTEHDFQEHLKNGRNAGNCAYVRKGPTSRAMVASRSKVRFWPDGSTSPGNYGCLGVWNLVLHTNVTSVKYHMYHTQIH